MTAAAPGAKPSASPISSRSRRKPASRSIAEPRTDTGAVRASILAGAPRYDVTILSGSTTETSRATACCCRSTMTGSSTSDLDGFDPVKPAKFIVPHIIYSLLIAYDGAKSWPQRTAPPGPTSGTSGSSRARARCRPAPGVAMAATFECALMADGVDPANLYPIDWDRAFKSLDKIKPSILKWWKSGAEGPAAHRRQADRCRQRLERAHFGGQ